MADLLLLTSTRENFLQRNYYKLFWIILPPFIISFPAVGEHFFILHFSLLVRLLCACAWVRAWMRKYVRLSAFSGKWHSVKFQRKPRIIGTGMRCSDVGVFRHCLLWWSVMWRDVRCRRRGKFKILTPSAGFRRWFSSRLPRFNQNFFPLFFLLSFFNDFKLVSFQKQNWDRRRREAFCWEVAEVEVRGISHHPEGIAKTASSLPPLYPNSFESKSFWF